MTFLKKMWHQLTKKLWPKENNTVVGVCDRCSTDILDGYPALCFHDNENSMYLCEPCVEELKKEFIKEEYAN